MSRMERQFEVDSVLINKEFLETLIKIIDDINPKDVGIKTEILIQSEQEKSTFENLKDFIECSILPSKIKSISIKKNPYNKKDINRTINFFVNIENSNNSYYRLIGYDDGKLSTCQKQLNNLFNRYKNWYSFLFKIPFPGIIPLITSISFVMLLWGLLPKLPYTTQYGENYKPIFLIIGGIFWYIFNKIYNFLFPFFDFQINRTKRSKWLRGIIGLISVSLIGNLIWKLIQLIFD